MAGKVTEKVARACALTRAYITPKKSGGKMYIGLSYVVCHPVVAVVEGLYIRHLTLAGTAT